MRTIKYRAWVRNPDLGEYILQDALRLDFFLDTKELGKVSTKALRQSNPFDVAYDSYDYDKVKLSEFTGLYDRNNKEIYEGDIIQLSNGNLGEVIWSHLRAGFDIAFDNAVPEELDHNLASSCEVVDNIYENKGAIR